MDDTPEIDVEKIRERIREKIRQRGEEPPPPDPGLPRLSGRAADVAALHASHDLSAAPLASHRRLLGPVVVLAKRTVRALLRPILERQIEYNRANARVVSALWQWTEWMGREQLAMLRALRGELSAASSPRVDDLGARAAGLERAIAELRADLARHERCVVAMLERVGARVPEGFDAERARAAARKNDLERLHVALEDAFRDAQDDIKTRLAVYLPHVTQARLGVEALAILDLGCGRGEWLELLRDHGVVARGVECNRTLVEECRQRGLDVVEGDAVAVLRGLPDASQDVVTAFHVVEHLPFETLVELLDETVRVLRPGGPAIFETPDLENVLVATRRFHLDPTRRRLWPSPVLKFLAEARGLARVEIMRLHPRPEPLRIEDESSELARRFNEYFYGPEDYAVIGWKP